MSELKWNSKLPSIPVEGTVVVLLSGVEPRYWLGLFGRGTTTRRNGHLTDNVYLSLYGISGGNHPPRYIYTKESWNEETMRWAELPDPEAVMPKPEGNDEGGETPRLYEQASISESTEAFVHEWEDREEEKDLRGTAQKLSSSVNGHEMKKLYERELSHNAVIVVYELGGNTKKNIQAMLFTHGVRFAQSDRFESGEEAVRDLVDGCRRAGEWWARQVDHTVKRVYADNNADNKS